MTRPRPWMLALVLLGCASDPGAPLPEPLDPSLCRLAVVSSDFHSSTVSLLTEDGLLCRDAVLSTASAPPGLVTALSGDVVLPRDPHPDGTLVLIDRFPNAVLTALDPHTLTVRAQQNVGTGFASNPQDALWLDARRALVSRLDTNPTPGDQPFDGGGDLLVVDLSAEMIEARVALQDLADPGLDPRPGPMARAGGAIWVLLAHLSRDFTAAGDALLVAVDPASLQVTTTLREPRAQNCAALAATPGEAGLWVACSGLFTEDPGLQVHSSALFYVDARTPEPSVLFFQPAADLAGAPLGLGVAALSSTEALVVALGDLQAQTPDRLLRVDREGGTVTELTRGSGPFALGPPLVTATHLFLPDADPSSPHLLRWRRAPDDTLEALSPVDANPSIGLPPRIVAPYR